MPYFGELKAQEESLFKYVRKVIHYKYLKFLIGLIKSRPMERILIIKN